MMCMRSPDRTPIASCWHSALKQPGPIHRAWGLFVLDHGTPRERASILARVRTELETRRDVYGYDLLAWSLFKLGRTDEAREAMTIALAQHTEDPLLRSHAAAMGLNTAPIRRVRWSE